MVTNIKMTMDQLTADKLVESSFIVPNMHFLQTRDVALTEIPSNYCF